MYLLSYNISQMICIFVTCTWEQPETLGWSDLSETSANGAFVDLNRKWWVMFKFSPICDFSMLKKSYICVPLSCRSHGCKSLAKPVYPMRFNLVCVDKDMALPNRVSENNSVGSNWSSFPTVIHYIWQPTLLSNKEALWQLSGFAVFQQTGLT